jgi:DNA repair protein SbcC/Rad50
MYRPKLLKITNILSWEQVSFEFKQGKAVIIVGDNRDDPGQRGNGSGKSGLTEGAVIAITGSCIRPIKNKEIVRRGCDEGTVELVLENTLSGAELKIWRRLYSGAKSGEYKMWENDIDLCDRYSDNNMFNAFVFETLGISKEDFYSFYVLEKTTVPFLLMGDTEKKKVVNRFSGANKVDTALPHVELDVAAKDKIIKAIDGEVFTIIGKQELLCDQIKAEEEKYSESGKQEQLDKIDNNLNATEQDILTLKEQRKEIEKQLKEKENEIAKIKPVDYSKKKAAAQLEVDAISKKIKGANDQDVETSNRKKEALGMKADFENSLAGLIECPKCKHEFKLEQEEDFDAEEIRETIKEVEQVLLEIEEEIKVNNKTLTVLKNEKIEKHNDLEKIEKEERTQKSNKQLLDNQLDVLRTNESNKNRQIEKQKIIAEDLTEARNKIKDSQSEKLDGLNEQLLKYVDDETNLRTKLQDAMTDKQSVEQWLTHFKSFKSHLANKSIANIQDYCNLYLQKMSSNIEIIIEGYKTLSNKKIKEEITTLVRRNGLDDASYGSYSGGEKGRIDICCIVAIQTLINLNSKSGGLDLLILDEVMDSVDSLGLENIIGALQNIDRTIMIVSQNAINALSEHTITIKKENRKSTIVC